MICSYTGLLSSIRIESLDIFFLNMSRTRGLPPAKPVLHHSEHLVIAIFTIVVNKMLILRESRIFIIIEAKLVIESCYLSLIARLSAIIINVLCDIFLNIRDDILHHDCTIVSWIFGKVNFFLIFCYYSRLTCIQVK